MRLEKTCRCIRESRFLKGSTSGECCDFIKGREYQVDMFVTFNEPEFYKVYQNGGYDDWALLDTNEFSNNFEVID